jgi:hypothetical protein
MKNRVKAGATLLALILCVSLFVGALAENGAPIAENLELTTYRGVSMGGRLSAVDPEGDAVIFEICTPPAKGTIELGDDGSFVYTPGEGRKGKDYFGYRAIDTDGNCSQEATVIIRIQKQKTKTTYSDMDGRAEAYAAVLLAENGIFVGEKLAGRYVFRPDEPVTRGEFLAMCMELTDTELLTGTLSTGFADDADIDTYLKPYVSTALLDGIIDGYVSEHSAAVFCPGNAITAAEAAVMLDRALGLTDAVSVWSQTDPAAPAWAAQSLDNLSACRILPPGLSAKSTTLSRADAAVMLAAGMDIIASR